MNPIIQKNLAMKTQPNAQNSASQPNNDAQLDQRFVALPTFLQENIKQSGVTFSNAQELQQVVDQMLKQGGPTQQ